MNPVLVEHGRSAAELFRIFGIAAALAAIALLLALRFALRHRISRVSHHWLLLIALFFLPGTALTSATVSMLEETKSVSSCGSCHVMHPFVNDLRDPQSETLAARHFRNKWIADDQCYSCHTTYGFQGTLTAKLGGLRHWALFVSKSWDEPIKHRGTYLNANCLRCHGGTPKYTAVEVHELGAAEIASDEASCLSCHDAPHPEPAQRGGTS